IGIPAHAQRNKCLAGKLKAIGKKENGLLACDAKAAAVGDPLSVLPCRIKVATKVASAFGKLSGCTGTEMDCANLADGCEVILRTMLPDGTAGGRSKCEAARLKAAGKKAKGVLGCYAKSAANGVAVDTVGCIGKVELKFSAAFDGTRRCTGTETMVEDAVD